MLLFSGINFPLCNNKSAFGDVHFFAALFVTTRQASVSYDQFKRHGAPQEDSDTARQARNQARMGRSNARCDSAGVLHSIGRRKKNHGSCSKQAVIVDYVMQLCKHAVAWWRIQVQQLISLIALAVV